MKTELLFGLFKESAGIATDSRNVKQGDIFLLYGERNITAIYLPLKLWQREHHTQLSMTLPMKLKKLYWLMTACLNYRLWQLTTGKN
jgi:hypothetical protein